MAGLHHADPALASFQEDVDKEILQEAAVDSWHRPRAGDSVCAEVEWRNKGVGASTFFRTWTVASAGGRLLNGEPSAPETGEGPLEVDRCVRTMRPGETSVFYPKAAGSSDAADASVRLRLVALYQQEDLFGDGSLTRCTVRQGSGTQTPQTGTELKVRFSWRSVASSSEKKAGAEQEAQLVKIQLGASSGKKEGAAPAASSLGSLQRAALECFPAAAIITLRSGGDDRELALEEEQLVEFVQRGDVVLLGSEGGEGVSTAEAVATLRQHDGNDASAASGRDARVVAISMEEGRCVSSAEDWLPGVAGLRVLSDLRQGQRCLVRAAPQHAFGDSGRPSLGLPPKATLEYDLELLQIMTLEDVSLEGNGSVMKKVTSEGQGYEKPTEGATVVVRLEAHEDSGGAVILEERELSFKAASGSYCSAIDETVLTMKKGETCEVRCSAEDAWVDKELGLTADAVSSPVVLSLEMISFDTIDLFGLEEPERVAHCSSRKEVGTQFVKASKWRRALKRYQYVTNALAYVDHWKDTKCKVEAIALRLACNLNAAHCQLKIEAWRDALKHCDAVLKADADNVKALFRRGQALKELREFSLAEQSFKKVKDLDPENKDCLKKLREVRESLKEESKRAKEMYSRMTRGIGESESSVQEKVQGKGKAPQVEQPSAGSSWTWPLAGAAAVALVCAAAGIVMARRRRVGA